MKCICSMCIIVRSKDSATALALFWNLGGAPRIAPRCIQFLSAAARLIINRGDFGLGDRRSQFSLFLRGHLLFLLLLELLLLRKVVLCVHAAEQLPHRVVRVVAREVVHPTAANHLGVPCRLTNRIIHGLGHVEGVFGWGKFPC